MILLIAIVAAGMVGTRPARAQSLEEALGEAYSGNPQLLAERAHLRAVDEEVPKALANWRPQVQMSDGVGYEAITTPINTFPSTLSLLESQGNQQSIVNTFDANITQPIYRGGRTVAEMSKAEKTIEAERAHLISTEGTVFLTVIVAYFDCLREEAMVGLAIENEQLLRQEVQAVQVQTDVGTLTHTDLFQTQSQSSAAVSDRHQAEGNLHVCRDNFQRGVGHPPLTLKMPKLRPVLPTSRNNALQLAASNNPDVIAALLTEDAGREAVTDIRGQLLPTVSAIVDFNRSTDVLVHGAGRLDTNDFTALAKVTVPLYEGGAVHAEARQAEETVGELKHQTDDARAAAVQNAALAWDAVESMHIRLDDLQKTVAAAEAAFRGMQQEQKVGARSLTDLLVAEQALYVHKASRIATEHDLALAEFQLARQLGRLNAADLKLNVQLYDVDKHYRDVRNKWFGWNSGEK
jgi:outer membrane protein